MIGWLGGGGGSPDKLSRFVIMPIVRKPSTGRGSTVRGLERQVQ